jgi:hypothetical protein
MAQGCCAAHLLPLVLVLLRQGAQLLLNAQPMSAVMVGGILLGTAPSNASSKTRGNAPGWPMDDK